MRKVFLVNFITAIIFLSNSCLKSNVTPPIPDVYRKIYGSSKMYIDGIYIVIVTQDYPDHKSPYYSAVLVDHEAYNGPNPNFQQNPYLIMGQGIAFRIPLNPVKALNSNPTSSGLIGISLNGVPFYNQFADTGINAPLTNVLDSFDQYNGHTQSTGQYHYHLEPLYLTATKGKDALLGFLLDGFPVYGPIENGKTLASTDLDALHGHISITADFPSGIYHYHITADAPYINGEGFYGKPGTVKD